MNLSVSSLVPRSNATADVMKSGIPKVLRLSDLIDWNGYPCSPHRIYAGSNVAFYALTGAATIARFVRSPNISVIERQISAERISTPLNGSWEIQFVLVVPGMPVYLFDLGSIAATVSLLRNCVE